MPVSEHVRASSATVRLTLRVAPGARGSEVVGRLGEAWKLRVRSSPERGRANREVLELLGDSLGVPPASLRIVAGHGTRSKLVEVEGLAAADVERRLLRAVRSTG